jgi:hypothetical protein
MLVGVQLESDRAAARLGDVVGAVEASSPYARLERDGIGFIARALLETRRTEPIDERGEQSAAVRLGYVGKDDNDFAAELDQASADFRRRERGELQAKRVERGAALARSRATATLF